MNNDDQTSIDLYGLNFESQHILPLDQRQIGISMDFTSELEGLLSLDRVISEINFDRDEDLPGENKNNQKITSNGLLLSIKYQFHGIDLRVHLKNYSGEVRYSRRGEDWKITRQGQHIIMAAQSKL